MELEEVKKKLPNLNDFNNLSDEELLDLYHKIDNFISYLKEYQKSLVKDDNNDK